MNRVLLAVAIASTLLASTVSAEARSRRRRVYTAEDVYRVIVDTAEVRADGTVEFHPPAYLRWQYGSSIFRFGRGADFREEKQRFLDETFELRAQMGARFRKQMARISVGELPWRLSALLCDPQRSLDEKKRLLFELWDDAAEPDDPEIAHDGAQARAVIEQFVAAFLPAGSPGAYTQAELVSFNRLRGRAPAFDPYAPGAGMVEAPPALPEHVDVLEREEPVSGRSEPSPTVLQAVNRALAAPAPTRRQLLFVAWDDATAESEPVDRAYVEQYLTMQRYPRDELARYASLRGDDAFTVAASR